MNKALIRASIARSAQIEFARAGGPGGQNVNKVNSKALARIAFEAIEGLSERECTHARMRLGDRITNAGELVVSADDERDQPRNKALALERLAVLIESAAAIPKPRRPTKPTRASAERRMASKRIRASHKSTRASRDFFE